MDEQDERDNKANTWFGKEPWGPVCLYTEQVPTPVGQPCLFCKEEVADGDDGQMMPYGVIAGRVIAAPIHRECLIRQIAGSVGHQQGRCSCYGGDEEDPPGMTLRQAAIAACAIFEKKHGRQQR